MHQDNPKLYWNIINDLKDSSQNSNENPIDSNTWFNHFRNLNTLDEKFQNRATYLESTLRSEEMNYKCFNELDQKITQAEISKALIKLKNNKATGLDNVSNEMLKCCQSLLLPCLQHMYNTSLTLGSYPKCWAESYITVLHKSNDKHNPNNYRGLSITSTIGKLFNSVLNNRLDSFLESHNIIGKCQIDKKS